MTSKFNEGIPVNALKKINTLENTPKTDYIKKPDDSKQTDKYSDKLTTYSSPSLLIEGIIALIIAAIMFIVGAYILNTILQATPHIALLASPFL